MDKLKPIDLRNMVVDPEKKKKLKKNPVYIVVDNVLDTYNIGSMFRLADAVAATKVILCGESETPPHTRIKKASINTTEWVDWEHNVSTVDAIANLRSQVPNIQIVAIEQDKKSVPYDTFSYSFPVALVVGHETHGCSKEVLDACDAIVEMPMWGINSSLNVMVSLGIVLYHVLTHTKK